jgi:hypothetical protein
MHHDDIEPMDEDLAALLRAGAPPITPVPDPRARVLARVTASVAAAAAIGGAAAKATTSSVGTATTSSVGTATTSSVAKLLVPLATFLLGGLGGVLVARRPAAPPEPRIVYVERSVAVAAPPPGTMVVPVVSASVAVASLPSASVSAPRVEAGLNAERRLLDDARSAFARDAHAECLRKLDLHRERHPAGLLAEEREALAIRALAAAGRSEDARARAARFRARYPGSLMLPAVEAAVGDGSSGSAAEEAPSK